MCLLPAHQVPSSTQCFPREWYIFEPSSTVELHDNISWAGLGKKHLCVAEACQVGDKLCTEVIFTSEQRWGIMLRGRGLMQAKTSGKHRLQSRAGPAVKGAQGQRVSFSRTRL